jgi:hypothetical protein
MGKKIKADIATIILAKRLAELTSKLGSEINVKPQRYWRDGYGNNVPISEAEYQLGVAYHNLM